MSTQSLYEQDFHAWSLKQAQLLREHRWDLLDAENIAEEIESLGRSDRREVRSRLEVLVGHLLKWEYQPENRSRSWLSTIHEQRIRMARLLQESPSLKPLLEPLLQEAYEDALALAADDTTLPLRLFPTACPYAIAQIQDREFLPDSSVE